jgi:CheY-like chemotaxis protein
MSIPLPPVHTKPCVTCGADLQLWAIGRNAVGEVDRMEFQCPDRHEVWEFAPAARTWQRTSGAEGQGDQGEQASAAADGQEGPAMARAFDDGVLVADDNEGVRDVVGRLLIAAGFQVTTAADGREALERLEQRDYALVIADLDMPHLDGAALIRTLRDQHPDVRTVLMTCYLEDQRTLTAMREHAFSAFLSKPFTPEQLKLTVDRALARPTPDGLAS